MHYDREKPDGSFPKFRDQVARQLRLYRERWDTDYKDEGWLVDELKGISRNRRNRLSSPQLVRYGAILLFAFLVTDITPPKTLETKVKVEVVNPTATPGISAMDRYRANILGDATQTALDRYRLGTPPPLDLLK